MAKQRSNDERKDDSQLEGQLGRDINKSLSRQIELEQRAQQLAKEGFFSKSKQLSAEAKALESANQIRQDIVNEIREQAKAEDELNKKLKAKAQVFSDLSKTLKNIPGIGGLISDVFTEAAKVTKETGSRLMGMLSVFDSIARVAGPAAILKSMMDISNQTQDINRNLGLGFEASRGIRQEFSQIAANANDVRINSIDLVKAQGQLIQSLGLSVKTSGEVSENFIRNSEYLGASVEAAGNLEKIIAITGANSTEFSNSLALAANESGKTYGVHLPLAKVVEKIKNLQGATLGYLMDSPEALAKAVAMSEKLGLEFSKIRGIADGLTNFQSSITNEIEAEVLLNRNLNLEKARALAFRGDEVGLAQELTRQVGSLAEYNQMLPIQQEAFAKALGMSRDEMANVLMQQELVARFGAQARDFSNEQLQSAKELAAEKGLSDAEALRVIQEQVSAGKQFEDAAQKIRAAFQDALVKFTPLIEKAAEMIGTFAKSPYAQIVAVGAAGIGTLFAAIKAITGSSPLTPMYTKDVSLGGGKMSSMFGGKLGGIGKTLAGRVGPAAIGGALGFGASALADQAAKAGKDGLAMGLGSAGGALQYGSLGFMIGGPVGAAVGALYGGITGYLDKQESVREAKRQEYEKQKAELDPVAKEIKMMRQALEEKETSISMDGQMLGKLQENRPYNGMNKPVLS